MPTIKRILDGKEYEIELTPAEIASVCEYAEHKAVEAVFENALKDRIKETLEKADSMEVAALYSLLEDSETISNMTEDYLYRNNYAATDEIVVEDIIDKYL